MNTYYILPAIFSSTANLNLASKYVVSNCGEVCIYRPPIGVTTSAGQVGQFAPAQMETILCLHRFDISWRRV